MTGTDEARKRCPDCGVPNTINHWGDCKAYRFAKGPEVSLPKSSDTKQGESIAKGAGSLKELARAWPQSVKLKEWDSVDAFANDVEAYGVACIKLGLERAKAVSCTCPFRWHEKTCVAPRIDKEIESLK